MTARKHFTICILFYKEVGGLDYVFRASVVVTYSQDFRVGIGRFKVEERLRIGGAEAVYALILVADHEKVIAMG